MHLEDAVSLQRSEFCECNVRFGFRSERTTKTQMPKFQMEVSWNRGTPKSTILMECSLINQPFWGTPNFKKPPNTNNQLSQSSCLLSERGAATIKGGLHHWDMLGAWWHLLHSKSLVSWPLRYHPVVKHGSSNQTWLVGKSHIHRWFAHQNLY